MVSRRVPGGSRESFRGILDSEDSFLEARIYFFSIFRGSNRFFIDFGLQIGPPGGLQGSSWGGIFNIFAVFEATCILTSFFL